MQFTLEMCAAAENYKKTLNSSIVQGSRSFNVIDVDAIQKLVTSACFDKQQVCTYLQPFSHYKSQQRQNNVFLREHLSLTSSFKGNPLTQGH